MCVMAGLAALGAGGATAAGATAAAGTIASTLQTVGTVLAIGGPLVQGIGEYQTSKQNVALIEQQQQTERQLNAVKDHREKMRFAEAFAVQRAEIVSRGVSLDSPTAIYLGQSAAREMSFNSQAIRSGGQAKQQELTFQQQNLRARGRLGLLRGGMGAAGALLSSQADQWAGLSG